MKIAICMALLMAGCVEVFSQQVPEKVPTHLSQFQAVSYAYVTVSKRAISEKLAISIDLGTTAEQVNQANEYMRALVNTKSHAAVLNYMAERGFELVSMASSVYDKNGYSSTGTTIWVMKKRTP